MTPLVSFGSQRSLFSLFQVQSCERALSLLRPFHPGAASRLAPLSVFADRTLPSAWARMNEIQEATSPATSLSGPAACVSKVELRVSCKALLDRDTLNKSDPCVILMVQTNGQWTEVSPSLKTCFFLPNLYLCTHQVSSAHLFLWLSHTRGQIIRTISPEPKQQCRQWGFGGSVTISTLPVWINPGHKSVMVWWIHSCFFSPLPPEMITAHTTAAWLRAENVRCGIHLQSRKPAFPSTTH